jgi:predicted enzyme related to lactoylglutathione lyase
MEGGVSGKLQVLLGIELTGIAGTIMALWRPPQLMTTHSATVPSGIGQIAITAHDLQRAVAFYRDTLGLPFLFEVPKMAFFDAGGVRLMLGVPEEPRFDHPASIIYYRVADIEAAAKQIAAKGASFLAPPHMVAKLPDHDLWIAFLNDSEGNTLALMSEVRPG